MAEFVTLARPYAKAAFAAAMDSTAKANGLTHWQNMLGVLADVVVQPKMQVALARPELTSEQQAQLLISVCGEDLDNKAQNFVRVLAGNKRLPLMPEIASQFQDLKTQQEKTVAVEVQTAFELNEAEVNSLTQALSKKWQCNIQVATEVNANLLGGIVIKAGDNVIDASVRGRLHKLVDALKT